MKKQDTIKGFTKTQLHAAFMKVHSRNRKSLKKEGFNGTIVAELKNPGKRNIRCALVAIKHFTGTAAHFTVNDDATKVLFVAM